MSEETVMKILYLDESGDQKFDKFNENYPIFVLGGVIVDKCYAEGELTDKFNALKLRVFNNTDIVLHTADIARNRGDFECLTDKNLKKRFYFELNSLVTQLDFSIIACAIRIEYLEPLKIKIEDPYLYCLKNLVDRFCSNLGQVDKGGMIIAESRGKFLDKKLSTAWQYLKKAGMSEFNSNQIEARLSNLQFEEKKKNVSGLQLADLIVSPIGRHVLGKPDKEDWKIIERKILGYDEGEINRVGLIILP